MGSRITTQNLRECSAKQTMVNSSVPKGTADLCYRQLSQGVGCLSTMWNNSTAYKLMTMRK